MTPRHQRAAVAALAVLVGLVGLVYWPGLSGPWLFDDFSNIRGNTFLRVTALDWQSLRSAAGSAAAGPLGRPIAYLSFALDHYLHGDASPYAYKLTNLVIHGLNALLVAALLCAVFGRLAARQVLPVRLAAPAALALTALWALHPIQISSVLYVVQRMTSLSATFGLAALLCWLRARAHIFVGAGHARDRDAGPGHDAANPETVAVAAMGRSYTPDLTQPPVGACSPDAAPAQSGDADHTAAAADPGFRSAASGLHGTTHPAADFPVGAGHARDRDAAPAQAGDADHNAAADPGFRFAASGLRGTTHPAADSPVGAGHARDRDAVPAQAGDADHTAAAEDPGFRFAASGLQGTTHPAADFLVGAGHARDRDAVPGHDDAHLPAAAVAGMARSYNIGTGRGLPGRLAPLGWLLAGVAFALLGAFTKETAVLLPLYALLLDRVLYPGAPYWQRWLRAPAGVRLALLVAVLAVVFGLAAWYSAPGYAGRPFTLTERVLTQARVLWFYIGLVALPRIDAFGLHHDDIALSTGLLAPWTTLPALLGVAGLALLGWRYVDRRPLIGLGLLWFLAGHVLESTVVPLEIAHEHRNYLPLLGLLLAGTGVLLPLVEHWRRRAAVALVATLGALLAATTALRADQWGDELGMSRYEVLHHPDSAQARSNLAVDLVWRGHYAEAREQLEAAIELAPWEVGYPINLVAAYRVEGLEPPTALAAEISRRIRGEPLSAYGQHTLHNYAKCLADRCRYLLDELVGWLEAYRDSSQPTFDRSYIAYLLGIGYREQGRIQDALNAFQRAHDLDPRYLHPLFEQANILLSLRQWDTAALVLDSIRVANEKAYQRLDRQIAELDAAIAKGRGGN